MKQRLYGLKPHREVIIQPFLNLSRRLWRCTFKHSMPPWSFRLRNTLSLSDKMMTSKKICDIERVIFFASNSSPQVFMRKWEKNIFRIRFSRTFSQPSHALLNLNWFLPARRRRAGNTKVKYYDFFVKYRYIVLMEWIFWWNNVLYVCYCSRHD